jgi:hypothetical protein
MDGEINNKYEGKKLRNTLRDGLQDGVQHVAPNCGPTGSPKWPLETLAVNFGAVILACERCNGSDRACGFTSNLGRLFVGFFVGFVF